MWGYKKMVLSKFFTDNGWQWRLARTIVQGILGALIANLDLLFGKFILDPAYRAIIVAAVMAILSPIMAEIGRHTAIDEGSDLDD